MCKYKYIRTYSCMQIRTRICVHTYIHTYVYMHVLFVFLQQAQPGHCSTTKVKFRSALEHYMFISVFVYIYMLRLMSASAPASHKRR